MSTANGYKVLAVKFVDGADSAIHDYHFNLNFRDGKWVKFVTWHYRHCVVLPADTTHLQEFPLEGHWGVDDRY